MENKEFKLSDEQKFSLACNYYIDLTRQWDEKNNDFDIKLRMLSYMTSLYDYDKFPKVFPDTDYKKLENVELYRGTSKNEYNANTLADFDYHRGTGFFCHGIFSSTSRNVANFYSNSNDKNVMSFKIDGSIIDFDKLNYYCKCLNSKGCNLLYSVDNESDKERLFALKLFMDNLSEQDRQKFSWCFTLDTAELAIILGYDAIKSDKDVLPYGMIENPVPNNVIVLNRGAIVVSQSEFDRICGHSRKYKGGVIDFSKKSENLFQKD